MAKKQMFSYSDSLPVGTFLIHMAGHQRLTKISTEAWVLHTTKPEKTSPEAFLSVIPDSQIKDCSEDLSKAWEVKSMDQGYKDWFKVRFPKLYRVDSTLLSLSNIQEFQAPDIIEDPILTMMMNVPIQVTNVEAAVDQAIDSLSEEELLDLLAKKKAKEE